MRESSSVVMKYSVLGWSHLLLLAVGFFGSCTTSAIFGLELKRSSDSADQVRLWHLYSSNSKTHMFLQITKDGEVSGTEDKNLYTAMEIKAVNPGIIVIRGKKTSLYLCMDESHRQYGSEAYKEEDCNFREDITDEGYSEYFSEKHQAPVTLKPPKGKRLSLFLPMQITIDNVV